MKTLDDSSPATRRQLSKFHKFLTLFKYPENLKAISVKLFSSDFKRRFFRMIQSLVLKGQEDLCNAIHETCGKLFFFWSKNSHKRSKRLGELLKSSPITSHKIKKVLRNSADLMGLFEYIFNSKYIGEETKRSACAEELLDLYIPDLFENIDEDIADALLDLPSLKVDFLCMLSDGKKCAALKPRSLCRKLGLYKVRVNL